MTYLATSIAILKLLSLYHKMLKLAAFQKTFAKQSQIEFQRWLGMGKAWAKGRWRTVSNLPGGELRKELSVWLSYGDWVKVLGPHPYSTILPTSWTRSTARIDPNATNSTLKATSHHQISFRALPFCTSKRMSSASNLEGCLGYGQWRPIL